MARPQPIERLIPPSFEAIEAERAFAALAGHPTPIPPLRVHKAEWHYAWSPWYVATANLAETPGPLASLLDTDHSKYNFLYLTATFRARKPRQWDAAVAVYGWGYANGFPTGWRDIDGKPITEAGRFSIPDRAEVVWRDQYPTLRSAKDAAALVIAGRATVIDYWDKTHQTIWDRIRQLILHPRSVSPYDSWGTGPRVYDFDVEDARDDGRIGLLTLA